MKNIKTQIIKDVRVNSKGENLIYWGLRINRKNHTKTIYLGKDMDSEKVLKKLHNVMIKTYSNNNSVVV